MQKFIILFSRKKLTMETKKLIISKNSLSYQFQINKFLKFYHLIIIDQHYFSFF